MISAAAIQQASLTDAPPASAIVSATSWVSDLLFGPLATGIAVIAMAWIGYSMLSGRMDVKRGLAVVLGCILLFGARGFADSLKYLAVSENTRSISSAPLPPIFPEAPAAANTANAFDPYSGATVAPTDQ